MSEFKFCPQCGVQLGAGSRFCNVCGHKLEMRTDTTMAKCPYCGEWVPVGANFCPFCGKKFGAEAEAEDAGVLAAIEAMKAQLAALEAKVKAKTQPAAQTTAAGRTCKYCLTEIPEGLKFCPHCGEEYGGEEIYCEMCGTCTTKAVCPTCGERLKQKPLSVDEVLAELTDREDVKKVFAAIAREAQKGDSNHVVLTGNPDTDTTAIVQILAKLFNAAGILPTDSVVEVTGMELKGAYIGLSKEQVNEVCKKARGGVLFVDEAYRLVDENGPVDPYAKEAVETLLMCLENDKDKFVCVAAGPSKEMGFFLDKCNPGMRHRFKHFINLGG